MARLTSMILLWKLRFLTDCVDLWTRAGIGIQSIQFITEFLFDITYNLMSRQIIETRSGESYPIRSLQQAGKYTSVLLQPDCNGIISISDLSVTDSSSSIVPLAVRVERIIYYPNAPTTRDIVVPETSHHFVPNGFLPLLLQIHFQQVMEAVFDHSAPKHTDLLPNRIQEYNDIAQKACQEDCLYGYPSLLIQNTPK